MAKNKAQRFTEIKLIMLSVIVTGLFSQSLIAANSADHLFFGKKDSSKKEPVTKNPIVEMDTNKGTIKMEIFADEAPITSKNFIDLVDRGFYNGLSFHRYEHNFCLQGGDPNGNGTGGFIDPATQQERTIPLEVTPKLKHSQAGMVAMARSNDPNSASSQFYFTLGPASFLDGQYAVFGKVIEGLNVVYELRRGDKMTKVFVLNGAHK